MSTFPVHSTDAERYTITVSDESIHAMAEGLGFNWFSTYDAATYPAPDDEDRWQGILDHASWLNMQFVRFVQGAAAMCDDRGDFVPGHWSFDQLRRLNQWAEARSVNLLIDPFIIPAAFCFRPWPGAPHAWGHEKYGYSLGVEDIDGYVTHFVVPYVRYVVEEMGCRAVRWFNHVNEPLGGSHVCATPPGIDEHVRYVAVLAAIRQGLDEAGLSHIGNMAPDTHTHKQWVIPRMLDVGADPDAYTQAYCMHHYHSRFDWDSPSSNIPTDPMSVTIDDQLTKYCTYAHDHGKPYLVTELGMFHYGWEWGDPAGIARHDNTVLEAEFFVRAMARGADAILRWAWLNPGNLDGWWQLIDTVRGSDAPLNDPYYSYGTLMRYVNRQAQILATTVERPVIVSLPEEPQTVHAVGVKNSDGSRTLLIVNDHYSSCAEVLIRFSSLGANVVRRIVNDPVRKHHECDEITVLSGELEHEDVLSPMSLTVYTTAAT